MEYSQTIKWTRKDGTTIEVRVEENTPQARQHAIEVAKKMGWTPIKWYEFWRKNDTRIEE